MASLQRNEMNTFGGASDMRAHYGNVRARLRDATSADKASPIATAQPRDAASAPPEDVSVISIDIRDVVMCVAAALAMPPLALLADLGAVCAKYQDEVLHGQDCKRVQCNEIQSFCYTKQQNVPQDKRDQFGFADIWARVALDFDVSW